MKTCSQIVSHLWVAAAFLAGGMAPPGSHGCQPRHAAQSSHAHHHGSATTDHAGGASSSESSHSPECCCLGDACCTPSAALAAHPVRATALIAHRIDVVSFKFEPSRPLPPYSLPYALGPPALT